MGFWTWFNLIMALVVTVPIIPYEIMRARRKRNERPHALLKIHMDQLAGERHPDMAMTYLSVYTAVPPPGEWGMPTQWIYFDFLVTGFDIWRLRQLLVDLAPEEQYLIVRCAHGPRIFHSATQASSRLHFTVVPTELQTIARKARRRRWIPHLPRARAR